jgi:hypothetical protein
MVFKVDDGEWTMVNEYRCYFFGTDAAARAMERGAANTVHILWLASDDLARQIAESIWMQCAHIRGFEIWQGDRFVYRADLLRETA